MVSKGFFYSDIPDMLRSSARKTDMTDLKTDTAFASWSGGKDSCLSLYFAEADGLRVDFLLNMLTEDGTRSRSHGLRPEMIQRQAAAMGKRIVFAKSGWEAYEKTFLKQLTFLKKSGVGTGVFGDIDLAEHRQWVERVCDTAGLNAVLPLWEKRREALLEAFWSSGFKAVIVGVKEEAVDAKWLGRNLDRRAAEEFQKLGIDLCGEEGEYHTFVYDGPNFRRPVSFAAGEVRRHEGYALLELVW